MGFEPSERVFRRCFVIVEEDGFSPSAETGAKSLWKVVETDLHELDGKQYFDQRCLSSSNFVRGGQRAIALSTAVGFLTHKYLSMASVDE